ncbi:hypothetical protein [Streptomyces sp. NPDC127084]|uniref:hypothetical protein n=1 Tax=Streptomyces sp. NPDC127084 TaxID=3347133 RepID=UPI00365FB601
MDAVLAALCTLAGTVVGALVQHLADTRRTQAAALAAHRQDVREAVVALASALSVHRGHLYTRWDLAHSTTAGETETAEARRAARASRGTVTGALYRLRVLSADRELLRAATEAVGASYAVKAKGEDLTTVAEQDLAERYRRALAADDTLLTACATRLAP